MNGRNRWITYPNDVIVRWGAFLPPPRGNAEPLIRLAAGIAASGERNAIFRPVRLPGIVPYDAALESFESYLRAQLSARGCILVFPRDETPGPRLWTPARLAFYRGDAVVEEEIGDAGALLRELRPDKVEVYRMFLRSASPVSVIGESIPFDWTAEVRVQFRLDTDIWFPRVTGMLESPPDDCEKPGWYDNQELAQRHTPRLNAFLSEIRQLTLELGGRWEILDLDGFAINYRDMWNDSGILV